MACVKIASRREINPAFSSQIPAFKRNLLSLLIICHLFAVGELVYLRDFVLIKLELPKWLLFSKSASQSLPPLLPALHPQFSLLSLSFVLSSLLPPSFPAFYLSVSPVQVRPSWELGHLSGPVEVRNKIANTEVRWAKHHSNTSWWEPFRIIFREDNRCVQNIT